MASPKVKKLYLYCDGGVVNNGKVNINKDTYGSFCTLLVKPSSKKVIKKFTFVEKDATNNIMELKGAIVGIRYISKIMKDRNKGEFLKLTIISDSQYLIKGCSEWMHSWKRKGWKNSSGKIVENLELWQILDELLSNPQIKFEFKWVRGHKGKGIKLEEDMDAYFNEQCDTILSEKLSPYR